MATLTTLVTFNGTDGTWPYGGLAFDSAGNLIGTTYQGGAGFGTVYEVANIGGGSYASTPTTLVSFDGTSFAYPYYGALIADSAGDLFGTTLLGGTGYGTVYEIPYSGGSYASTPIALVQFNSADGINPYAGMITDANGDLFSTTYVGGAHNLGTVFEIPYSGGSYDSTPTTLFDFDGTNGQQPTSSLIADTNGNLFGTTFYGGADNKGTVYELVSDGAGNYTPNVLVSFDGTNGQDPYSGLVADAAGDLFGTTYSGGANNHGTVFELVNSGGSYTLTTLFDFDGTHGSAPIGGLIMDAAGNLFGTTFYGGDNDSGTVFEIAKTGGSYATTPTILTSFDLFNNVGPTSTLIADSAGNLYGTTQFTSTGGNGDGTVFELTDTGFQTCFLRGSLIATPTGEVAVEQLAVGDLVQTHGGDAQPITWIGTGRVLATRGSRSAATPVIVRRAAFADNVPHHDLHVTKGHSFYLDGVLIPVEFLVNHRSIVWDDRAQEVEIYHIELARHDVLLANGSPAESYRDDGNRWLFQNGNTGWFQPPKPPCAPVLTGGPIVDAVWRRLLDRDSGRPGLPLTDDPDLHLLVDGKRVDGTSPAPGVYLFRLPRNVADIQIASRDGVPAELGLARDPRPLGVAVRQIRLWHGAQLRVVEASDPSLGVGFHRFEADNGFRWTTGDAVLPAELFAAIDNAFDLELHVASTTHYPLLAEPAARAAA